MREFDNITPKQLNAWRNGELLQNVFSHLSPEDREWLMTGITPEEWRKLNED